MLLKNNLIYHDNNFYHLYIYSGWKFENSIAGQHKEHCFKLVLEDFLRSRQGSRISSELDGEHAKETADSITFPLLTNLK